MGSRYLDMLEACEATVGKNVTENLYERHLKPLFLGGCSAKVAVLARNREKAAALLRDISGPGQATIFEGDALKLDDLQQAAEAVVKEFGRIDCLINSAGGNHPQAFLSTLWSLATTTIVCGRMRCSPGMFVKPSDGLPTSAARFTSSTRAANTSESSPCSMSITTSCGSAARPVTSSEELSKKVAS